MPEIFFRQFLFVNEQSVLQYYAFMEKYNKGNNNNVNSKKLYYVW